MTTQILEAFDELNRLDESYKSDYINISATDTAAALKLYTDTLKNRKKIDLDAFHMAYDSALSGLGLLSIFNGSGALERRGVYGDIIKHDKNIPAVKAAIDLWVHVFKDNYDYIYAFSEKEKAKSRIDFAAKLQTTLAAVNERVAKIAPQLKSIVDQKLLDECKKLMGLEPELTLDSVLSSD